MRRVLVAFAVVAIAGCATAPKPQAPAAPTTLHGVASWYGQEFAGRTTANGEIFDPLLLTAAHRTLPFGTVCDVSNPKTGQTVRVRINDRGPYINGRMIDLSYAAAQQIGLIQPGSGDVDIMIVKLGNGEREPPAPLVVAVPDVTPIPETQSTPPATVPVVVDNVTVVEEHKGVETRLQVSPDGKKLVEMPIKTAPQPVVNAAAVPPPTSTNKFVVQVGAFAQEANAKELMDQLAHIGQNAYIDQGPRLYKVRIGPFDTRDQAIAARGRLETAGMSAIVIAQ